jgi:hypothetical protein
MRKSILIILWLITVPSVASAGPNQNIIFLQPKNLKSEPVSRWFEKNSPLLPKTETDESKFQKTAALAEGWGIPESVTDTAVWFYGMKQKIIKIREAELMLLQNKNLRLSLSSIKKHPQSKFWQPFLVLTADF